MVQFEDLEIWDYVPGYSNYKVSSKGRVWSSTSNKIMKPSIDSYGYYVVGLTRDKQRKHHKVHRLVALTFYFVDNDDDACKLQIDHIDRVKTNNKLLNLRFCTGTENNRNQGIQRNNTSGYKGVGWSSYSNTWRARIHFNGKRKCLGSFDTKEEAYEAYKKASQEFYGDFGYAP